MKTEWVHKKLGDCCESELGKTLDEGRNTGLYRPYLCALNVLWGKIDISIIKQMRIEDSELERYLVKKILIVVELLGQLLRELLKVILKIIT